MPEKVDVPTRLFEDRYWRGVLHIFMNQAKLQHYFTLQYFDLSTRTIKAASLKQLAKPWSQSERFMLNLALHLYNEQHKVNLSDMDYLDSNNKEIAFEAIRFRYV